MVIDPVSVSYRGIDFGYVGRVLAEVVIFFRWVTLIDIKFNGH